MYNENNKLVDFGWLFLLLSAIAAFLRFYNIGVESLWRDELYSVVLSSPEQSLSSIVTTGLADVHPLLYQILLWFWMSVFGDSEISARNMSALFSFVSLPIFYLLSKKLFSPKVAVVAVSMLATNYFAIEYAQEARSYSLFLFLSICCYYFYFTYFENLKNTYLLGFLVSSGLIVNVHFFGFFVIASIGFMFVFDLLKAKNRNQYFKGVVVYLIGLLVFLLPVSVTVINSLKIESFWIQDVKWGDIQLYMYRYFGNVELAMFAWVWVVFSAVHLVRKGSSRQLMFFINSLIFLIIVPVIYSVFKTPILTPRNTIVFLPILILFLSTSIGAITINYVRYGVTVVAVLLNVWVLFEGRNFYHRTVKQHYNQLVYVLNDRIVNNVKLNAPYYAIEGESFRFNYYMKRLYSQKRVENYQSTRQLKTEKVWFLASHNVPLTRKLIAERGWNIKTEVKSRNAYAFLVEVK